MPDDADLMRPAIALAEESGMGGEAEAVVHGGEVPWQPDNSSLPQPARDDGRGAGVLHVDVDKLRRTEHGRRDEREGSGFGGGHFRERAGEHEQVGATDGFKFCVIADADVAAEIGRGTNDGREFKLGRRGVENEDFAAAFGVLLELRRGPIGGDDEIELALAEPIHIVGDGEGNVSLAQ